jgi:hypothetical protein
VVWVLPGPAADRFAVDHSEVDHSQKDCSAAVGSVQGDCLVAEPGAGTDLAAN